MPLISPPPNEEPKREEVEPIDITPSEDERIRQYLDVANWKCHHCNSVVFGRCDTCPYCRHKLGIVTRRVNG